MWTVALQPPLTAAARRPAPRPAGPQNPRAAPSPAASSPASSLLPSLSPAARPGPAHLSSAPQPPPARRCPAGLQASREETLFRGGRLLFACRLLSGDFCSFARSVPGAHGNPPRRCVQAFFFLLRSAFFVTLRRGCSGYFCNFPPPTRWRSWSRSGPWPGGCNVDRAGLPAVPSPRLAARCARARAPASARGPALAPGLPLEQGARAPGSLGSRRRAL